MNKREHLTARDLSLCALGAVLIAVCSWVSVPSVVPFTMQTFAVFCILFTLGAKLGTLSVAVYLLLGAVGLPVFSQFQGGVGALLGVTGGYLVGFLFMGPVYGAAVRLFGTRLWVDLAAMTAALAVLYAFGTSWFVLVYTRNSGPVGYLAALTKCVFPFVIPDLLKLALARAVSSRISRVVKIR